MKTLQLKKLTLSIPSLLVLLTLVIIASPTSAIAFSGTGDGSVDNPYIITNVTELQEMKDDLDACYKLNNDIPAQETSNWEGGAGFIPIGGSTNFTGSLDGNGHKITGLHINRNAPPYSQIGLFGTLASPAVVKNLGLVDVDITGIQYMTGGLAGQSGGTITNCYVTGTVTGGIYYTGGLVGYCFYGSITGCHVIGNVQGCSYSYGTGGLVGFSQGDYPLSDCYVIGTVTGVSYTGGLVGQCRSEDITRCYADADVIATGSGVGGLVGYFHGYTVGPVFTGPYTVVIIAAVMSECYSKGTVTGIDSVGGLVGTLGAYIEKSCSVANVNGHGNVGGLVGYLWPLSSGAAHISDSYARGSVHGTGPYVGGLVGLTGIVDIGNRYSNYIRYCYSTGLVTGSGVDGFIGCVTQSEYDDKVPVDVEYCFWDMDTAGTTYSCVGAGMHTAEMKTEDTYSGWDFPATWYIDTVHNDGYPNLGFLHNISGYVRHGDGTAIPGAEVTLKGAGDSILETVTTEPNGYYIIKDLYSGDYIVTASYSDVLCPDPGYPFTPISLTFDADRTDIDICTYVINGYVKQYGTNTGINDIDVKIKQSGATIYTLTTTGGPGGAGYYEKRVGGGTYTIEAAN